MRLSGICVYKHEATSNIDVESENDIMARITELAKTKTVILISHRITTLMQADLILVLQEGRVAELGSHEELMAKNGLYREVYDLQMTGEDRELLFSEEGGESHGV